MFPPSSTVGVVWARAKGGIPVNVVWGVGGVFGDSNRGGGNTPAPSLWSPRARLAGGVRVRGVPPFLLGGCGCGRAYRGDAVNVYALPGNGIDAFIL